MTTVADETLWCPTCAARAEYLRGYATAALRMRERCVEAIKGLWTTRKGNDYNSALNHAIERVESLTLEGTKEQ